MMVPLRGVAAFVALDQGVATVLAAAGSTFPPAVACISALGCAAAYPPAGAVLNRALGPGAAWLRTGLPLFLVGPLLYPLALEPEHIPGADRCGRLAMLYSGGMLITMASTGYVAAALIPASATSPAALASVAAAAGQRAAVAAAAQATRALSSLRLGGAALAAGGATTLLMQQCRGQGVPRPPSERAPAYLGLTVAAYSLGMQLPALGRLLLPPMVLAMLVNALATRGVGGRPAVREYLDGAGAALLAPLSPVRRPLRPFGRPF
jgi:hypothetical protein